MVYTELSFDTGKTNWKKQIVQQYGRPYDAITHTKEQFQLSMAKLNSRTNAMNYACRIPFLTKRKKPIRYTWCKLRQKWDVERWRKVIYTNESMLMTERAGKPRKVRRSVGTEIAFEDRYLAPTFSSGRISICVRVAITHDYHIH
jgi:hypothetical protein